MVPILTGLNWYPVLKLFKLYGFCAGKDAWLMVWEEIMPACDFKDWCCNEDREGTFVNRFLSLGFPLFSIKFWAPTVCYETA